MDIIEEEVKTKRCPKCERVLPLSSFSHDKSSKDGRFCYCKDCKKELKKAYYAKHRGEILKKKAEWRANNKEKIAEYQAEWRANNKEKIAEYQAEWRANNKEKIAEYQAEYYQANKDEKKAYMKAYTDPILSPLGWAKRMVNSYRKQDRDNGFDTSKTISA